MRPDVRVRRLLERRRTPRAAPEDCAAFAGPVHVLTETNGWILHRCAQELASLPGVKIVDASTGDAAIEVYLPASRYYLEKVPPATGRAQRIGFFTHAAAEDLPALVPMFQAHVAMNREMQARLRDAGAPDPIVMRPGASGQKSPIRFGVCGRTYPTGRKGEGLIAQMVDAGYDVRAWGAGWPCPIIGTDVQRLSEFYRSIDYLVVPSELEGGPVPVIDAIAHGVPVIAPNVGWCWEFPVIRYARGEWASLHAVLEGLTQPPTWAAWTRDFASLFARLSPPMEQPVSAGEEALPTLAVTMRTADRAPAANYVGATVRRLLRQGLPPSDLHLCVTSPDTGWLERELAGAPVTMHVPDARLSPNANGLAQVRAVIDQDVDWILLLEDDLGLCADFLGSVRRWLAAHARVDRHVYQFFGFARPPHGRVAAYDVPLKQLRASQAIALRRDEARDFLAWGEAHLTTWRSPTPWGTMGGDPHMGFDKFVAAWSLTRWPGVPGLMSHPHFVKHVGLRGSMHGRTVANDALFGGERWSYQGASA